MATITSQVAEQVLDEVLNLHRGPGGAVVILQDGEVVAKRVWGYADMDQRVAFAADTRLPICSITKQFLCLLIADLERESTGFRERLNDELTTLLPKEVTEGTGLTIQHLCNMQSGLRDYFALATLWGTQPESEFLIAKQAKDSLPLIKSFHFEPGTMSSYSNINFYVLGRLIEKVTGQDFGTLIRERIFSFANMKTAELCANNANLPPPCIGYEGSEESGYYPATNRMEWSGDAGGVASLNDMIAYEQFFDRSWNDSQSLVRVIGEPQKFKDGTEAMYGNGLLRANIAGFATIGHGGSLRGYQLHRRYVPSKRLSVFVMFNYQNKAQKANFTIVEKLLSTQTTSLLAAASQWNGIFFDPDTQLVHEVKAGEKGKVLVAGEQLNLVESNRAESYCMTAAIDQDILTIQFLTENLHTKARRIIKNTEHVSRTGLTGSYRCSELESVFHCSGTGETLYGCFDGYLGQGPIYLMRCVGEDVWLLANPRGLDTPAPGDWTIVFERDAQNNVVGVVIGCLLARRLKYVKLPHNTSSAET